MLSVSIVIPTLNEEAYLERTLRSLNSLDPQPHEILVVDGGSKDQTKIIAQNYQVQVIETSQAGRSLQMNQGAAMATGDILCFLHADTLVPDDLVPVMQKTLADPTIACGGFISLMCGQNTTQWTISLHNYLKTYYGSLLFCPYLFCFKGLRILFGDQVMFCRSKDFWQCEGFNPNLPIMEDVDLCLKLNRLGRIYLVNRVVQSSDRRVAKWGVLKATLIYFYIGLLWRFGKNTTDLKQFYQDIR